MSGSESEDDWEKQLEDESKLEKNLNQEKQKKFVDEDKVDSDEERKKVQEAQKKEQASNQPKVKKDKYEEMFEKRKGGNARNQKLIDDIKNSNLP